MLASGQWTEVRWVVVGPVVVDVVNLVLGRDPATDDPVLVGFDVAAVADFPSQSDVSMRREVPVRLVRRDLLPRGKRPDRSPRVAPTSATVAPTALASSDDRCGTVDARDHWHDASLQVSALCHRTFAGVSAFDSHRSTRGEYGECRDVGAMPGLEFRDGMWRGPEMPEGLKGQRRAEVTR